MAHPSRPAPASERMSLNPTDLIICGHIDGVALRFGPGPEVSLLEEPSMFGAMRLKRAAVWALLELEDVLAKTSNERSA